MERQFHAGLHGIPATLLTSKFFVFILAYLVFQDGCQAPANSNFSKTHSFGTHFLGNFPSLRNFFIIPLIPVQLGIQMPPVTTDEAGSHQQGA